MPVTTAQTASGSAPFRPKPSAPHRHINLLRGWPAASLLPAEDIAQATSSLLVPPFSSSLEGTAVDLEKNIAAEKEKERKDVVTDLLEYGPDLGFGPLRDEVAQWLTRHFSNPRENERKTVIASMEKTTVSIPESAAARICITGGASQNLANVLLSFSDPEVTRAVWLIRPVYFLACPIFEDAGFGPGRLHGVPEDEEGVNIGWLRTRLERFEEEDRQKGKARYFFPFLVLNGKKPLDLFCCSIFSVIFFFFLRNSANYQIDSSPIKAAGSITALLQALNLLCSLLEQPIGEDYVSTAAPAASTPGAGVRCLNYL